MEACAGSWPRHPWNWASTSDRSRKSFSSARRPRGGSSISVWTHQPSRGRHQPGQPPRPRPRRRAGPASIGRNGPAGRRQEDDTKCPGRLAQVLLSMGCQTVSGSGSTFRLRAHHRGLSQPCARAFSIWSSPCSPAATPSARAQVAAAGAGRRSEAHFTTRTGIEFVLSIRRQFRIAAITTCAWPTAKPCSASSTRNSYGSVGSAISSEPGHASLAHLKVTHNDRSGSRRCERPE